MDYSYFPLLFRVDTVTYTKGGEVHMAEALGPIQLGVLPGDGIGPEVIEQALRVLYRAQERFDLHLEVSFGDLGGIAIERHGNALPEPTRRLVERSDAVLVGAVGGPRWDALPFTQNPGGGGLLRMRRELDLYANLRPVRLAGDSPIDLLIVREGTAGAYAGRQRASGVGESRRAVDEMSYTVAQVRRILTFACDLARARRSRVVSVDKANVLASGRLWREVAEEVFAGCPDLSTSHMHVDNCAAQLVLAPEQFDVIVTDNLFGDILSDQAAALSGSLGMAGSACLGVGRPGLYEPIHGSAPTIAGLGVANPVGAIRSLALLFRYSLARAEIAAAIEDAVDAALASGARTADLRPPQASALSTAEFGDRVLAELAST